MEQNNDVKFDTVESEKIQDLSHLFKTEGNSVYMITQEQYDKEQAEKKARRKEKRKLRKEAEERTKNE